MGKKLSINYTAHITLCTSIRCEEEDINGEVYVSTQNSEHEGNLHAFTFHDVIFDRLKSNSCNWNDKKGITLCSGL